MDPLIGKTAKSKPLTGVDPLFESPQKFDSKAQAAAAYNRIMTGAAQFQQMINFHVVNSARRPDPVERADSLDKAIHAGERMLEEFRRARNVLMAVSPLVPAPPTSVTRSRVPEALRPRTF